MEQLILHLFGDYVIQSDWMAQEKTKRSLPAMVHAVTYTLPFLLLTQSWPALAVICLTHFVVDRWRLARYVCWVKNFLAPRWIKSRVVEHVMVDGTAYTCCVRLDRPLRNHPWSECSTTGYHQDRPAWMSVWLLIIADNTLHLAINYLVIRYL